MCTLIGQSLSAAAGGVALLLLPFATASSHEAAEAREGLGDVHFATSCTPAAQEQFDRAVATLHSFWYEEAVKAFAAVAQTDPTCAIGYWGVAMSHWYPLWYPPSEAALSAGSSAVEKARAVGAKTQRERDYIAAIEAFYQDWDKLDHRSRSLAYAKAMEQVYITYPDDPEAGLFYALALNATALPTDKTYANQLKAAAILEKVFAEQPNHPGVAHYLIHSYDSASLAPRGLAAARRYATIAPAVPHALHMPSHLFTRLGLWQESIDSNLAAHTGPTWSRRSGWAHQRSRRAPKARTNRRSSWRVPPPNSRTPWTSIRPRPPRCCQRASSMPTSFSSSAIRHPH